MKMDTNTASNPRPENSESENDRYCLRSRRSRVRNGHVRWSGGVLLMAIGALLLLQNLGSIEFTRSWSLLIMIPATAAFANAWRDYAGSGRAFTGRVISSLAGGLVLTTITIVLLLDLQWEFFGPVILLMVGFGIFVRGISLQAK